jgi:hypothetical protein
VELTPQTIPQPQQVIKQQQVQQTIPKFVTNVGMGVSLLWKDSTALLVQNNPLIIGANMVNNFAQLSMEPGQLHFVHARLVIQSQAQTLQSLIMEILIQLIQTII